MALDVEHEVRTFKGMTVGELRRRFREIFDEDTRSFNKPFLVRRIAWQLQAKEHGGLSERALSRAAELADTSFLRTCAPKRGTRPLPEADSKRTVVGAFAPPHDPRLPLPGSWLTRSYRGETVTVQVLDEGFEYRGQRYRSLTAIAEVVTGSHMSGNAFFGLRKRSR